MTKPITAENALMLREVRTPEGIEEVVGILARAGLNPSVSGLDANAKPFLAVLVTSTSGPDYCRVHMFEETYEVAQYLTYPAYLLMSREGHEAVALALQVKITESILAATQPTSHMKESGDPA